MYFVGRRKMKVGKKMRFSGEKIPEAALFPGLRRMLQKGDVTCDYADGELPWSQLPPVSRSSIIGQAEMIKRINEATGVLAPSSTRRSELAVVYTSIVRDESLEGLNFDWLKAPELAPEEDDDLDPPEIPEYVLAALMDIDEATTTNTLKSLLRKAHRSVEDGLDRSEYTALAKRVLQEAIA